MIKRVLSNSFWLLVISLLLTPTLAFAQSGTEEQSDSDIQKLRSRIYHKLDSIVALDDSIPDDTRLPITRTQAEELIAKIVTEARAPYMEQRLQKEAIKKYQLSKLKERLLEQVLIGSYIDPYKERLDRLERLLYALLLSKGDIDPTVINNLLTGTTPGDQYIQPYIQVLPQEQTAQETPTEPKSAIPDLSKPGQKIPAEAKRVAPRALSPEEIIVITPDAPADKIEYFMSQVFFGFDSYTLTDEAKTILDNVATWMQQNSYNVSLRGYASLEGNIKYNNRLSRKRVSAVADYLQSKGVEVNRIEEIPSGIDSIKEEKKDYPDARRVDIRPVLFAGYY